jgi:hypothetical protein
VIQLEAKKDMKRRLLPSPNRADALALSFAFPISRKDRGDLVPVRQHVMREHDPYARSLDTGADQHNPYANLR